jgi:hypothetical protein
VTAPDTMLTVPERDVDYDDDDEYKPVWPSGLWATSQA